MDRNFALRRPLVYLGVARCPDKLNASVVITLWREPYDSVCPGPFAAYG
jgi:hypothetical protein